MKTSLFSIFFFALLIQGFSQHTVYFDTYNTNDALIEEVFDAVPLTNGMTYDMKVKGTYSIWAPSYWTRPCGNVERAPLFTSPVGFRTGTVGTDMEYFFALPNRSKCNGNPLPLQTPRIEISLDSGATWFHPQTQDPYNQAHTYNYQIIGQGFPLGIRHLSALNSDDYGQLEFELVPLNNTIQCPKLSLNPNPARGRVIINRDIRIIQQIIITSLSGQVQKISYSGLKQDQTQIDISNLPPGIYFVTVISEKGEEVIKIIIK